MLDPMAEELEVEEPVEDSAPGAEQSPDPVEPAADPQASGEDGDSNPAEPGVPDDGEAPEDGARLGDGADGPAGDASADSGEPEETPEDEAEGTTRLGPGAELDDDEIQRRMIALLFASPEPLSLGRLVVLLERPQRPRVKAALEGLDQRFERSGLPFQVRGLKGGYALMSTPEVGPVLGRLARGQAVERVSAAALETLSVVAYRQPVTKAEIEAIRGVQAGPILRSLVDRGLIKVAGRADVPGHPLQYATTKEFLDRFGLMNIGELPRDAELTQD